MPSATESPISIRAARRHGRAGGQGPQRERGGNRDHCPPHGADGSDTLGRSPRAKRYTLADCAPRAVNLLPVLRVSAAAGAFWRRDHAVVDWFVMTDELLYERLAFCVARVVRRSRTLRGEQSRPATTSTRSCSRWSPSTDYVPGFLHGAHSERLS